MQDLGDALVALALVTSGLAAVAVAPRNRAAQALLVCAAGDLAAVLLAPLLPAAPPTPQGALLIQLQTIGFLVAILGIVAVLMLHPRGTFERRWHAVALVAVIADAVLTELVLVLVAPRMSVDGSGPGGLTHANPLAVPALAGLEPLAELLWTTTLAWPLVGVAVLVDRLRTRDRGRRREALLLLGGVGVLAVLLAVQLAAIAAGIDLPAPEWPILFRTAVAAVPVALLVGIAARVRRLDADLAAANARLGAAEDGVRRDIERDLHDGVQQQLVGILVLTQLARREHERGSVSAGGTLREIGEQVEGAIGELRELVRGIRPPVLADAGVPAALAARLERLPADVALTVDGDPGRRWAPAVESAAYFVGCEAVTNALKHAPGSRVAVTVRTAPDELVVAVADDGPGGADRSAGRGLAGLEDRVRSLGGRFELVSATGGGTRVTARFPRVEA